MVWKAFRYAAVVSCAAVLLSAAAWSAPELKVSGFVQARYTADEAPGTAATFSVRRARLTVDAALTPQTAARVQLDASGTPAILDAYCVLSPRDTNATIRLGQFKLPIAYDIIEPCSKLLERELSEAWTRLVPKNRDAGVYVQVKGQSRAPSWDLAIVNGNGLNKADNNQHKDVLVREVIPLNAGSLALAYYTGKFTTGAPPVTTVRTRLTAGADLNFDPVGVRAEYVRGRDLGADVSGGYLRLSGKVGKKGDIAFAKYDLYDENTDVPDTTFRRLTIGYVQKFDAQTRLTALYQIKDVDPGYSGYAANDGNLLMLEAQMEFGG
jgi:hypothetical protein